MGDHVEALAKEDQMEMVNTICDIYCQLSGEEPSTPELYELFANIKASFAKEATEEVLSNELDDIAADDDSDDEDYDIDQDPAFYGFDAVDDVLFHDLAFDETDSADSDYSENQDEAEELTYAQDKEDDVASDTEEEVQEEEEEEEEKAGEVESDSEYSPDKESYFYFSDYQDELVEMSSSDASSSESTSASEYAGGDVYDPKFDMNSYASESFQSEESEEEDEYSYSEEADKSASEEELDDELAA